MLNINMKHELKKLSGLEQKLYFTMEGEDERVICVSEAAELLNISADHARVLLSNMVRKGAFERIKPGLYARVPAHIVSDKGFYTEDSIIIASHVAKPYYIAYHSALNLHGIAEQFGYVVYVASTKQKKTIKYRDFSIKPVTLTKNKFFGFEKIDYAGKAVKVSDLEKTIIDCMDKIKYCGIEELVKAIQEGASKIDWNKFLQYLDKMNEQILVHKAGYLLDMLSGHDKIQENLIKELKSRLSRNIYYMEQGVSGEYSKKWRIIVRKGLEDVPEHG
jgi:predicted transcriptional regulator of viral defense system